MNYSQQHIKEADAILNTLDAEAIEKMAELLATVKADQGRLFFFGCGRQCG